MESEDTKKEEMERQALNACLFEPITTASWKSTFYLQPSFIRDSIRSWLLCSSRLAFGLPSDITQTIAFWALKFWYQ